MASLVIVDIAAFYTSLVFAYFTRKFLNSLFPGLIPLEFSLFHFLKFWWIPVTFLVFLAYERLYVKRLSFWDEIKELIKALTISIVVILAISTLGRLTDRISRLTVILLGFYSFLIYPFTRFIGKKILYKVGLWKENLIIIGAGRAGLEIAKGLDSERYLGYNIIGFLDDDKNKIGKEITVGGKQYKVFGKIKNFKKFVGLLNISTVLIAVPSFSIEELSSLTNNVQRYAKRVLLIPDLKGIALVNTELYHLFMQQMFLLKINNNLKSMFNRGIKRSFDIAFSILFLPLLLLGVGIIGVLIRLDSKGPIFLVQDRIGKAKKIFKCVKFRTMYMNAEEILDDYLKNNYEAIEEWNKYKKLKNYDPRVTKIGKFLRKTSLDELPQIFNVLKGEMSLFGPRPYLPEEDRDMRDYSDLILLTQPGITGLWQVSGRNDLEFEDRLKLDAWYVLNWSLWLDIVILFKTIKVVLKMEGAY
ncbi:MAG: undecaprenyl-phosphate galactose phosphotransferase WbaP [Nitrospirae bacterium]|nr:undecaprenyl-phosphate galactose phosphotransferase WbaP [Nitrospirota bacterium]